jgi:cytochrome c oxidase subunit 2
MVVLMRTLLLAAAAALLVSTSARVWVAGHAQGTAGAQTVDIAAERFAFTPSEVRTTVGTTLTIRLTSDDTAHGFRIVGANVNTEIPKRSRGTATVTFTPAKAGRYTFECSRLCGAGHSFMRGVIVVSDPPASGK